MPLARNTDPATSHEAAASAEPLAKRHRRIIFDTLKAAEPVALAGEEIADSCGLSYWQVMRRMSELERENKIFCTSLTHMNRSGRRAYKYALKSVA